jgi:lipopolysaccharide heptosyltransferase II
MKILVRLPNWLGDVVMSTALLNQLSDSHNHAQIDVIIKPELAPLLNNLNSIHYIWTFSKKEYKGLKGLYKFGSKLRKEKYDKYITLPDSFSGALIGYFAGIPQRTGYANEFRSLLLTEVRYKKKGLHRVREYLNLNENVQEDAGISVTINPTRASINLPEKFILFNANSEAVSRRIPVRKSSEIINRLTETTDSQIILTGTHRDKEFIQSIIDLCNEKNRIRNLAGKTSLSELVYICSRAELVISTDSGIAHVANATGTRVIVLFGAGNELNTAPFTTGNLHIIRKNDIACAPCVSNQCKFGEPKCLNEISVEDIIQCL